MTGTQSQSDWTTQEKLQHLDAAHVDLCHLRGRDGIVAVLKEELGGKVWANLEHDAAWFVMRCEECRLRSTRGKAKPEPRHLPRPDSAGEVVGWDLKTVKPPKGAAWVMLLAVDFASRRCFAWDIDTGSADLKTVQGIMLRFAQEHDLVSVGWTDNGGQFRNIVESAMHEAFGVTARHIPPGHPQSNGLVEAQIVIEAGMMARLASDLLF